MAAGVCIKCGQPRVSALHCEKHRAAAAQYALKRLQRLRGDAEPPAANPRRACALCRNPGHYQKSCWMLSLVTSGVDEIETAGQSSHHEK